MLEHITINLNDQPHADAEANICLIVHPRPYCLFGKNHSSIQNLEWKTTPVWIAGRNIF